jgi:2-polyprenyl-6-methoxyphenol hydroxylase-like FAD-dependent oxidoreductase
MHVPCVVAGGGSAGMMLGLLLARAGVRVELRMETEVCRRAWCCGFK